MTSTILFYWISWGLWIIVTFFMKKNPKRTIFASWILVFIITSNIQMNFKDNDIHIAYFILFFSIPMVSRLEKPLYHLFSSFTIMIGYVAILLWERITPIWFLLSDHIIIPVYCAIIIIFLSKDVYSRLLTGILGLSTGEFIDYMILLSYDLNKPIGEFMFFKHLLITIVLILAFELFQKGKNYLRSLLHTWKRSSHLEKKKIV